MLFIDNYQVLILLIPALVLSLCIHEFSHGIVAYYCGDDTAARYGRLTLNPLKHLDPIGSIMLLLVGFGYAKPVPVNPINLNNPRSDMIKIAAAGPISNLLLSFFGLLIFGIFQVLQQNMYISIDLDLFVVVRDFFNIFVVINVYLALFNLIPVYPLDGGQIFGNILSKYNPDIVYKMNLYGPKILFAVIMVGLLSGVSIIGAFLQPVTSLILSLFSSIINFIFGIFI